VENQSVCVFVALIAQYAKRMRHIVICGPAPLYTVFPQYLINGTIFWETLLNIKRVF
jgi:hypothetical protein